MIQVFQNNIRFLTLAVVGMLMFFVLAGDGISEDTGQPSFDCEIVVRPIAQKFHEIHEVNFILTIKNITAEDKNIYMPFKDNHEWSHWLRIFREGTELPYKKEVEGTYVKKTVLRPNEQVSILVNIAKFCDLTKMGSIGTKGVFYVLWPFDRNHYASKSAHTTFEIVEEAEQISDFSSLTFFFPAMESVSKTEQKEMLWSKIAENPSDPMWLWLLKIIPAEYMDEDLAIDCMRKTKDIGLRRKLLEILQRAKQDFQKASIIAKFLSDQKDEPLLNIGRNTLYRLRGVYPEIADVESWRFSPSVLLKKSDLIAVIKLTKAVDFGEMSNAIIIKAIKGGERIGDSIVFQYPYKNAEEEWACFPPQEGVFQIVFMVKNKKDGIYMPTTRLLRDERRTEDGQVLSEQVFDYSPGNQSVRKIQETEIEEVAGVLCNYLIWDKANTEQRENMIWEACNGFSGWTKSFSLDWLIVDHFITGSYKSKISNKIVDSLLACLKSPDAKIRQYSIYAIRKAFASRRDLFLYLIDALENSELQAIAVDGLTFFLKNEYAVTIDTFANDDEKIRIIKNWWAENGRNVPGLERYVSEDSGKH